MAIIPNSVPVGGIFAPTDSTDTFAINDPQYGIDGLRSVATVADMGLITTDRRRFGMLVTVNADGTPANNGTYILANIALGGFDNTITNNANFIKFTPSAGVTGSGTTNFVTKWTSPTALGNSSIFNIGSNVGIGTTTPGGLLQLLNTTHTNPNTTYTHLFAGTMGMMFRSSNSDCYLFGNTYTNNSSAQIYASTGGAASINLNSSAEGNIDFATAPSGTAGNIATLTTRMKITQGGNVGIGTTAPLARLDIAESTTAIASLRLQTGVAPTAPNNGDMWIDSTQKKLITYPNGIKETTSSVLAVEVADSTLITNTVTETTIVGPLVGTDTLPANYFAVGRMIRIKFSGIISFGGTPTVTVRVRIGGISGPIAFTSQAYTLGSPSGDQPLMGDVIITCRAIGSPGAFLGAGEIYQYSTLTPGGNYSTRNSFTSNTSTAFVNTTIAQQIVVSLEWGTASVFNSYRTRQLIIESLN